MNEPTRRGYHYTVMRLRSAAILLGLTAAPALSQVARGRTVDEGTFSISAGAANQTENFKITRGDDGLVIASGQLIAGTQQVTSTLTVDSAGSPVKYDVLVRENGAQSVRISVTALPGRLTALSYNQRGDQSMHEYPLAPGRSVILDEGLLHELYFVPQVKHAELIDVIAPRDSRARKLALVSKGLEPVSVGGRSLTGTHYVLGDGPSRREFWTDASGRVLRVEIPSLQLVATREDPPK